MADVNPIRPIQLFSMKKFDEFRDMPLRARLSWLEEANALATKVLGFEKRAVADDRFQFPLNASEIL